MKKSVATIIVAILLIMMTAGAIGKVLDVDFEYRVANFDDHDDLFDLDDWFD